MSEEKELKLACLHQAGGDLDHAQRLFDWVSGSVRATPDSEAAEVSAPKQDKPQQSFNYRHPSKYGTDVPRRCYLEELTPEERAIRDLVDTVERLGAHPLLTATVIQLMKAGEDLADWVDIGLRDKAIAALSPGNDLGLLDDGQQETSPVQSAIDQDKAYQEGIDAFQRGAPRSVIYVHEDFAAAWFDGWDDAASEASLNLGPANLARQIPEGFTPWSGGECPVPGQSVEYLCAADDVPVKTDRPEDWTWRHEGIPSRARIIAYRIIQPSAEAERIEDVSEPLATIEQTLITDDIPSIPREEIPIGAAVETYTDSGLETVKISGTTYVVDDEPVAEASYAPINSEPASDALMWANGFEADAKAKAEPEQDKRPFWVFGKKELA